MWYVFTTAIIFDRQTLLLQLGRFRQRVYSTLNGIMALRSISRANVGGGISPWQHHPAKAADRRQHTRETCCRFLTHSLTTNDPIQSSRSRWCSRILERVGRSDKQTHKQTNKKTSKRTNKAGTYPPHPPLRSSSAPVLDKER